MNMYIYICIYVSLHLCGVCWNTQLGSVWSVVNSEDFLISKYPFHSKEHIPPWEKWTNHPFKKSPKNGRCVGLQVPVSTCFFFGLLVWILATNPCEFPNTRNLSDQTPCGQGHVKCFFWGIFLGNFSTQNCGIPWLLLSRHSFFWGGLYMSMEQCYQGLGGVKMHVVLKEWNDYLPAAAENCLVVREHPSICQVNKTKSNVWKVQSMNMLHVTRMLESPPQKEFVFQLLEICKNKSSRLDMITVFFGLGD